jgi:hypothetical protein
VRILTRLANAQIWVKEKVVAGKEFLEALQAIATIVAILVGGWWTYTLFVAQGGFSPGIKIDYDISSKALSRNTVLLHLRVRAENTGRSLVEWGEADVRVQQILPLDKNLQRSFATGDQLVPQDSNVVRWPVLCRYLTNIDYKLRPGEIDAIDFDFILPSKVKTVRVYSFIGEKASTTKDPKGWSQSSIFNIPEEKEPNSDESDPNADVAIPTCRID